MRDPFNYNNFYGMYSNADGETPNTPPGTTPFWRNEDRAPGGQRPSVLPAPFPGTAWAMGSDDRAPRRGPSGGGTIWPLPSGWPMDDRNRPAVVPILERRRFRRADGDSESVNTAPTGDAGTTTTTTGSGNTSEAAPTTTTTPTTVTPTTTTTSGTGTPTQQNTSTPPATNTVLLVTHPSQSPYGTMIYPAGSGMPTVYPTSVFMTPSGPVAGSVIGGPVSGYYPPPMGGGGGMMGGGEADGGSGRVADPEIHKDKGRKYLIWLGLAVAAGVGYWYYQRGK